MSNGPVCPEGMIFWSEVFKHTADVLGWEVQKVRERSDFMWANDINCSFPVIDAEILYANMIYASPRYIWKWETLEDILSQRHDQYLLDYKKMYMQANKTGETGIFEERIDFTDPDQTAEWIVEESIREWKMRGLL